MKNALKQIFFVTFFQLFFVFSPEVPNLLAPIPASPGPSQTELEPSVYNYENEHEEEETILEEPENETNSLDETVQLEDSLEARLEQTIKAESTELPQTPTSIKAAELSEEALTKAISDLSAVGGKITPELVKQLTLSEKFDLLAVGI